MTSRRLQELAVWVAQAMCHFGESGQSLDLRSRCSLLETSRVGFFG